MMKLVRINAYRRYLNNLSAIDEMVARGYLSPMAGRDYKQRIKERFEEGDYDCLPLEQLRKD